jgi:hypothetical protein
MIDESLATAARQRVSEIAGEKWSRVESEIQDGGTFVLFSAWIEWGEPKVLAPDLGRAVAATISEMIPSHPQQELGSWMVNVWYGAALVDTIFPNEL